MINNKEIHENLIKKLKDPKEADLYLSSVLEKCKDLDKKEVDQLLQEALKNLAEARPEDININVNENSFKLNALFRFLNFISKNFM